MKVVIQRVKKASCTVDNEKISQIDNGLCLLVGFTHNDNIENIKKMIKKIVNLRIFDDENGIMNKSVLDVNGSILSISQFTLYADCKKGNRPSYIDALAGDKAVILYDKFNELLNEMVITKTGRFGADMKIDLINDGPVTIILEN